MRLLNLTLGLTCLAATACGDDDDTPGDTDATPTEGAQSETETPDPTGGVDESTGEPASTGARGRTGGEEATTGDEASTGSEDTTGANADCYAPESSCLDKPFERFECGGASVCEALEVNDPSLNEFDEEPFGFVNPEAATCILEGLRDATAGTYRIEVEPGQQYSRWTDIEVLADGSVVVHASVQDDKCIDETGTWAPLQAGQVFQDCIDSADEATMLDCMRAPGDAASCIEGPTVCP